MHILTISDILAKHDKKKKNIYLKINQQECLQSLKVLVCFTFFVFCFKSFWLGKIQSVKFE